MFYRFIGFFALLLLSSCAQVGVLSGGDKDDAPPRVKTMTPENKGTQFKDKEIIIEFDEFVKLNNPTQSITVIPPDFKVNATSKGKTVTLNWTEDLQPSTTYSIFLNKTIQDITEANDSIMQLVFSTGDFIDSLTYSVAVVDARTSQPIKSVIIGLFSTEDTLKPSYFSESDTRGLAQFNFVKEGTYFLRAFVDENKDLKISKAEKMGFKKEPINLLTSIVDSIPMSIFQPIVQEKITNFSFIAPGLFTLAANRPISNAKVIVNEVDVTENVSILKTDSIQFTLPEELLRESSSFSVQLSSANFSDSAKLRITEAAKSQELKISLLNNGDASNGDNFEITASGAIGGIDKSKFIVTNPKDSTVHSDFDWSIKGNQLFINFPESYGDEIGLELLEGAISSGQKSTNKAMKYGLKRISDNQLGIINLDASKFEGPILIEVHSGGKIIQELRPAIDKKLQLKQLKPGDYTFKVIADTNDNGYWDTGDFQKGLQPEEVFQFSEPTKVRANWEINVELIPKELK